MVESFWDTFSHLSIVATLVCDCGSYTNKCLLKLYKAALQTGLYIDVNGFESLVIFILIAFYCLIFFNYIVFYLFALYSCCNYADIHCGINKNLILYSNFCLN